jgi:hypothetical protein
MREKIEAAMTGGDRRAMLELAGENTQRVLRYLVGRLCSDAEERKLRAVESLGWVVGERDLVGDARARELLRRLLWSLNDESGAVPYGVPEAVGEILAVRPELQESFLPILCALVTEEEMAQTGPIERGALWALGRLARSGGRLPAAVVAAVERISTTHADASTREAAGSALALLKSP